MLHRKWRQKRPFVNVFQNRCFWKFCKFHRKTPVLESLFNKHFYKRLQHRFSAAKFVKFVRTPFLTEHLQCMFLWREDFLNKEKILKQGWIKRHLPFQDVLYHLYFSTGFRPATLLKKRLWHRCFPLNFAKFLRTPFFTEHLRWLPLYQHTIRHIQSRIKSSTNL